MNFFIKPIKWGIYSAITFPTIYLYFNYEKNKKIYNHPIVYGLNYLLLSINGFWLGYFYYLLHYNLFSLSDKIYYLKHIGSSQ
jgi:hypothetical protein